jgi:transcriptional regulator with XRE-family HTH domain
MFLEKNLKKILAQKKMTMMELSRKTGVPKSNINSWLAGANPNLKQLNQVAQFLETTVDQLAFGKNNGQQKEGIATITIDDEADVLNGTYEIKIKKLKK